MKYISTLHQYYKDVKAESTRVSWSDRRYVITSTIMVCIVVFIASLCCLFVDFGANKLVSALLKIKLF